MSSCIANTYTKMSLLTGIAPASDFLAAWQADQQAQQYVSNHPTNGTNASKKHIFIVSGPSGCGKSTVADHLGSELGIPFLEGDDVSHVCLT